MNIKYLSILLAVIGIIALYAASTLSQPAEIELSELPNYEGKEVIITGIVTDYYLTRQGSQMIYIKQNNITTKIFSEEAHDIERGDQIRAQGSVQKYQGNFELMVNNKNYITVLQKWDKETISLKQLSSQPEKYNNLNINVTGKIKETYGTLFLLTDENNQHSLTVIVSNSSNLNLEKNQEILIHGKFTYDRENLRYQLLTSNQKIFFIE